MLQELINHSPDIQRLVAEGYELELNGAYLLVQHIPYVNAEKKILYGSIVTVLTLAGPNRTAQPADHTVYFCGEKPCNANGTPLVSIIHSSGDQQLTNTLVINHYFSSRPVEGNYPDFYEKIRTYAEILCAQAITIDPGANSRPFKKSVSEGLEPVFQYADTNSARAKIDYLNAKFFDQKIGIIGLGGTGSYVLDLVSKTPVAEIHLFDADVFQVHNAFRAPGAVSGERLNADEKLYKVEYFYEVYSQMHKGIKAYREFITETNVQFLSGLDFVFICVDSNRVRQIVIKELVKVGISFIDVGLGVNLAEDSLVGMLRITTGTKSKKDHLSNRIGEEDGAEDEYGQNIQIADLNCLNAVLAVIKWKKMLGFYQDLRQEHNSIFSISTGKLIHDDVTA